MSSSSCHEKIPRKYELNPIGKIQFNLTNSQCHYHFNQEECTKPCQFVINYHKSKEDIVHFKDENITVKNFTFHCKPRPSISWYILNPRRLHIGKGDFVHVEHENVYKVGQSYVSAELVSFLASTSLENENKTIGNVLYLLLLFISKIISKFISTI